MSDYLFLAAFGVFSLLLIGQMFAILRQITAKNRELSALRKKTESLRPERKPDERKNFGDF